MAAVAFSTLTAQLVKAGADVRDAKEAWDMARETRDGLIVEASDQGMPQRAIAKATQLSQPRILAVLLNRTGFIESEAS